MKPTYDWVSNFSDGLAAVRLDLKSGYIDKDGNLVVAMTYSYTLDFRDGLGIIEDCSMLKKSKKHP